MASSSSSSSSSEAASSSSSHGESRLSSDALCKKIAKKLSVSLQTEIVCADHRRASECMFEIKTRLLDPSEPGLSSESKMALTCSGVHVFKRIVCGGQSDTATDDLKRTMALLFVLIVLSHRERSDFDTSATGDVGEDVEMEDGDEKEEEEEEEGNVPSLLKEETLFSKWQASCLNLKTSGIVTSDDEDLKSDLPHAHVCRLCMQIADQRADMLTIERATELANVFFHQSSLAMSLQLFNQLSKQGADFLTLSSASFLAAATNESNVKLAAIADIAESEAGQSVLRDFILSFTLPRNVLGIRKTCLLTRSANNRATKEYPMILNDAHDAAMRGATYSWSDDPKTIHKICALLAGIAVILTKNAQSIRRDDAFQGRMSLPFLETCIEPQHEYQPRMQYVSESDDWIVYKLSSKTGMPNIEFRGNGFEGCCQACLLFMNYVDS